MRRLHSRQHVLAFLPLIVLKSSCTNTDWQICASLGVCVRYPKYQRNTFVQSLCEVNGNKHEQCTVINDGAVLPRCHKRHVVTDKTHNAQADMACKMWGLDCHACTTQNGLSVNPKMVTLPVVYMSCGLDKAWQACDRLLCHHSPAFCTLQASSRAGSVELAHG